MVTTDRMRDHDHRIERSRSAEYALSRDGIHGRPYLAFDDKTGRMTIDSLNVYCDDYFGGVCSYQSGSWQLVIEGFSTTFGILQTYEPTTSEVGFRVPYMPEGFPAADWFDTYYGDLATIGDWNLAQPLQCGYPPVAPSAGDFLTVADAAPDPRPGHGVFFVTAVNYQGQRRKRSSNGVLPIPFMIS